MILQIEYGTDSTTYETQKVSLDLVGSDISVVEFTPGQFANPAQTSAQGTIIVNLHGKPAFTHATAVLGKIQVQVQANIGRNFGPNVWLWYSPTDDRNLYRARVLALDFVPAGSAAYFRPPNRNMEATITIDHGVWQGALTQVPLANWSTTNVKTLADLTIDNSSDTLVPRRDNTAYIDGDDVIGDIPSPAYLKITNTTAADEVYQYWISNNVNSAPLQFNHVLEAEAATPLTAVAKADASGASVNELSTNNTADDPAYALKWDVSSTIVTRAAGNQFHLLIKSHPSQALSDKVFFRAIIKDSTGTDTFYRGEQVSVPGAGPNLCSADLGVIRIPPWRVDLTLVPPAGIDLILQSYLIDGATGLTKQYIDAIYLFPVDSFRNLKMLAGLGQNDYLIDDMIEGTSYIFSGGAIAGVFVPLGTPILLHPGRNQRLYFLAQTDGGDTADHTSSVAVWYRPLKLVI